MGFLSSDAARSAADSSAEGIIDPLIWQPKVQSKGTVLPPFEKVNATSYRHEVNPAIALNLLSDIQQQVASWQQELRQLIHSIDTLTEQGPMVDGWLESSQTSEGSDNASERKDPEITQPSSLDDAQASLLRHGDTDALMQYVNALENQAQTRTPLSTGLPINSTIQNKPHDQRTAVELPPSATEDRTESLTRPLAQYRLCMLGEDGSVRSQLCPPEQMALVSSAIARYQKFKQLVIKKDTLETKLQATVDGLTQIRELTRQGP